jgi:hypothetical protein
MQFGPRTETLFADSRWRPRDKHPLDQCFADELEHLLDFAAGHGQLDRYTSKLCSRERDSAIAELRVASDLADRGFQFDEFEPAGTGVKRGEFLVFVPSQGVGIFTEVKAPDWHAEVTGFGKAASDPECLKAAKERFTEPKYRNGGGSHLPGVGVEFAIEKAYEKLPCDQPTLVVVPSNGMFESYRHSSKIIEHRRLLNPGGPFDSDKFERLGAVGLFWYEDRGGTIVYDMEIVTNSHATPANALPQTAQSLLHQRLPKQPVLRSPLQIHPRSVRP